MRIYRRYFVTLGLAFLLGACGVEASGDSAGSHGPVTVASPSPTASIVDLPTDGKGNASNSGALAELRRDSSSEPGQQPENQQELSRPEHAVKGKNLSAVPAAQALLPCERRGGPLCIGSGCHCYRWFCQTWPCEDGPVFCEDCQCW